MGYSKAKHRENKVKEIFFLFSSIKTQKEYYKQTTSLLFQQHLYRKDTVQCCPSDHCESMQWLQSGTADCVAKWATFIVFLFLGHRHPPVPFTSCNCVLLVSQLENLWSRLSTGVHKPWSRFKGDCTNALKSRLLLKLPVKKQNKTLFP